MREGLLVAIDRSRGRKVTLYSIVASSVDAREVLMYIDVLKHVIRQARMLHILPEST